MGQTERKNVIIVGAGASKEFGLPTGNELKSSIAKLSDIRFASRRGELISGDYRTVSALEYLTNNNGFAGDIYPYQQVAWQIRDNMPIAPSIDNFLDTHKNNEKLVTFGKIAITQAILDAERGSILYKDPNDYKYLVDYEALSNTWLGKLFSILVAQRDFQTFLNALNNITFVSFNYDRCIHQFITLSAKQYFDLESSQMDELLENLNVVYPYGTVGKFRLPVGAQCDFGNEPIPKGLLEQARGIQTFTEGAQSAEISKIIGAISEAKLVMFMGFGFLRLNMNLLFGDQKFVVERVLATAKGQSKNSITQIEDELGYALRHGRNIQGSSSRIMNVHVVDTTCSDLVFEFERTLSI